MPRIWTKKLPVGALKALIAEQYCGNGVEAPSTSIIREDQ
ncbi:Hypothetical protein NGAL_HAMBI2427_49880 [Neorhizobium galegae bv. orientalis]|uniref:Uncharacterized protein n=1 Tax=Neorhizobium galegae bv. orientalis str. HAMBI 540 TaxID=1028800 RepID=A0A068T0S6_NEOGA|nr:Hypothetical protein RG540_PA13170 [Neorhizobium galegae bv. orientalis str. HAMBI 540]CDZ53107.1 Hypothetical protein NGAL_HAMBI2427_49880 [Neorhizobium galegae bv. orientalis]